MVRENLGKSRFFTLSIMAIAIAGVSYVVGSQDSAPPGSTTATIAPASRYTAAGMLPPTVRPGDAAPVQTVGVEPTLIDPTFRALAIDPAMKSGAQAAGAEASALADAVPNGVARLADGPAVLSAIAATGEAPTAASRPEPRQPAPADPAPAEQKPAN